MPIPILDGDVSDANTKVYVDGSENFKNFFHFLGMSKASIYTKASLKKQIRRTHSVFSHVGP